MAAHYEGHNTISVQKKLVDNKHSFSWYYMHMEEYFKILHWDFVILVLNTDIETETLILVTLIQTIYNLLWCTRHLLLGEGHGKIRHRKQLLLSKVKSWGRNFPNLFGTKFSTRYRKLSNYPILVIFKLRFLMIVTVYVT